MVGVDDPRVCVRLIYLTTPYGLAGTCAFARIFGMTQESPPLLSTCHTNCEAENNGDCGAVIRESGQVHGTEHWFETSFLLTGTLSDVSSPSCAADGGLSRSRITRIGLLMNIVTVGRAIMIHHTNSLSLAWP